MKKKNGFTLIELLAIIVILAIIAVITVPLILGVVDDAKKGAAEVSANGYKDAVNKFYATKLLEDSSYSMQNKTYTVSDLETAGLTISGQEPDSESWITIFNNDLANACLQFGEYKVNIINGNVGDAIKGECLPSVRVISGTKGDLQSGDVVKIGDTEDFYVVSSDNSINGKTILLAKYNLNVGYDVTMVQQQNAAPTQTRTAIQNLDAVKQDSDFSGCTSSDSSCKASLFSSSYYWIDFTTNPSSLKSQYSNNSTYHLNIDNSLFYDSDSQVYPYVYDSNSEIYSYINGENGYLNYLKSIGAPISITGRLMTIDEALISGCTLDQYGNNPCTGWITETQFYLGSAISSTASLEISGSAIRRTYTILGRSSNINAGVRPIIEIETSYIQ